MPEIAGKQLLSFIERVEHVTAEIEEKNNDKRDIFAEAKANGFDVKALKTIIKMRREDKDALAEQQAIVDLYLDSIEQAEFDLKPRSPQSKQQEARPN